SEWSQWYRVVLLRTPSLRGTSRSTRRATRRHQRRARRSTGQSTAVAGPNVGGVLELAQLVWDQPPDPVSSRESGGTKQAPTTRRYSSTCVSGRQPAGGLHPM